MARPRIVVVNDNPEFLDMVTEALQDGGYDVSGHEGDYLSASGLAAMKPDLVILDLVLGWPARRASGWEFLILLRAHPDLRDVPVIVCSGDAVQLREREEELKRVGGTYVLPKPFNLDALDQTVRLALDPAEEQAS